MDPAGPFALLGHRFDVRCPTEEAAAQLKEALRCCEHVGPAAVHYVADLRDGHMDITCDDQVIARGEAPDSLVDIVCRHANGRAIAGSTAPLVLHAAALASHGRAVVVAGESGAGKTTIATRLMSRGWAYMTDEAVQVTDDLDVLPYIKPLVHKTPRRYGGLQRRHVAPDGALCRRPMPLGGLMLLDVTSGTPAHLTAAIAALAFPGADRRRGLALSARLAQQVPVAVVPRRPDPQAVDRALTWIRTSWSEHRVRWGGVHAG